MVKLIISSKILRDKKMPELYSTILNLGFMIQMLIVNSKFEYYVLDSARTELMFFIVPSKMLRFGLRKKTALIARCF